LGQRRKICILGLQHARIICERILEESYTSEIITRPERKEKIGKIRERMKQYLAAEKKVNNLGDVLLFENLCLRVFMVSKDYSPTMDVDQFRLAPLVSE